MRRLVAAAPLLTLAVAVLIAFWAAEPPPSALEPSAPERTATAATTPVPSREVRAESRDSTRNEDAEETATIRIEVVDAETDAPAPYAAVHVAPWWLTRS